MSETRDGRWPLPAHVGLTPSSLPTNLDADGLADFDPDPAASDCLWRLKETDSDAGVRDSAAAALGVWRDERVVDYFLRKLDGEKQAHFSRRRILPPLRGY